MKIEPVTTTEQAVRALADGKRLEFRAVMGRRLGGWVNVGSAWMPAKEVVALFDDLLKFGQVRSRG